MEPVSPIMLLRDLSRDRSNWTDVRHYPDTVTLRRMIRLADFAAQNQTMHAHKINFEGFQ